MSTGRTRDHVSKSAGLAHDLLFSDMKTQMMMTTMITKEIKKTKTKMIMMTKDTMKTKKRMKAKEASRLKLADQNKKKTLRQPCEPPAVKDLLTNTSMDIGICAGLVETL